MATLSAEVKKETILKFGKSQQDSGNSNVQVALLTHRIRQLTEHIKENPKDFHSRLGLTKMVSQRRRHLKYLEKNHLEGYRSLIKQLGLRH